jgi:hypothetical protein
MRKIFQVFALFFVLLGMATLACGQRRITFKRGARTAVVNGTLSGYGGKKVFIIRVRRGQALSTEQIKPDASNRYITVSIRAPNGSAVGDSDASCNNRKEISPTRAGDYRIEVYECQKADPWRGNFRLKVRVE